MTVDVSYTLWNSCMVATMTIIIIIPTRVTVQLYHTLWVFYHIFVFMIRHVGRVMKMNGVDLPNIRIHIIHRQHCHHHHRFYIRTRVRIPKPPLPSPIQHHPMMWCGLIHPIDYENIPYYLIRICIQTRTNIGMIPSHYGHPFVHIIGPNYYYY